MDTTARPERRDTEFSRGSIALTVIAVLVAVLLAPVAVSAVATPLPAGSYDVDVDGAAVNVTVTATGSVAISAEDGVVVELELDPDGQALDHFTATTTDAAYEVVVDVHDDGTYTTRVVEDRVEDEVSPTDDAPASGRHSTLSDELAATRAELVSAVARCAPRGTVADDAGWPNHGTVVSAAASGLSLTLPVPEDVRSAVDEVEADLGTVGGVIAFCDLANSVKAAYGTQAAHTVD